MNSSLVRGPCGLWFGSTGRPIRTRTFTAIDASRNGFVSQHAWPSLGRPNPSRLASPACDAAGRTAPGRRNRNGFVLQNAARLVHCSRVHSMGGVVERGPPDKVSLIDTRGMTRMSRLKRAPSRSSLSSGLGALCSGRRCAGSDRAHHNRVYQTMGDCEGKRSGMRGEPTGLIGCVRMIAMTGIIDRSANLVTR
jgi:hypothetical protein